MSKENRVRVLGHLAEALEGGLGMSVKVFLAEYCAVAKHAEVWVKARRRDYGALADRPAFERVVEYLGSSAARLEILACMRSGTRLDGTSAAQPGIEQCRALVAELEQVKKRSAGPSEFRRWAACWLPLLLHRGLLATLVAAAARGGCGGERQSQAKLVEELWWQRSV